MRRLRHVVLVLHHQDGLVRRIREDLSDDLACVREETWDGLLETVAAAPQGSVVVADPFFGAAEELVPAAGLRDLRTQFPHLPVVAAWHVRPEHLSQIRQLGAWGVADVVDLGASGETTLLGSHLERARGAVAERILPVSELGVLPRTVQRMVQRALNVAMRGGLTDEWAGTEGVSARTLLRRCERVALPPPRRLLAWMRVLLASDLMDSPGHSLGSAATAGGYAADMPLRRALENLVGGTLGEIRARGALHTARAAFLAEVAQRLEALPPEPPRRRGRPPR